MDQRNFAFKKMHSLGNDFVIFGKDVRLSEKQIQRLSHRRLGIGCDQVLQILPSSKQDVHASLYIFNSDGTRV